MNKEYRYACILAWQVEKYKTEKDVIPKSNLDRYRERNLDYLARKISKRKLSNKQ